MYACVCEAVTCATVEDLVAAGVRDVDEVGRRCGAGTSCGGCLPVLEEMLRLVSAA